MANQRPIRRGKIPFRKGRKWISSKRPKRWAAFTNEVLSEPIGSEGLNVSLLPNATLATTNGNLPVSTMLDGEFDVAPWADEQEVTIDRIVGTLSVSASVQYAQNLFVGTPGVVRLGIIVHEDKTSSLVAEDPRRKLFEFTDLQEAEWMWLKQLSIPCDFSSFDPTSESFVSEGYSDIDIDIRVRRKLGQKDQLFLYGAYSFFNGVTELLQSWSIKIAPMTRIIMVAK